MPVSNLKLPTPDPFILNSLKVNQNIARFFKKKGFIIEFSEINSEVDVKALLHPFHFHIESRGNQAMRNVGSDIVFDSSQISIHLAEQIEQIMRFQQVNSSVTTYFILGNPNIPRIRERISKIEKALDQLGIIRC